MVRSCCAFGPFEYLIRLFSLPPSLMTEGEEALLSLLPETVIKHTRIPPSLPLSYLSCLVNEICWIAKTFVDYELHLERERSSHCTCIVFYTFVAEMQHNELCGLQISWRNYICASLPLPHTSTARPSLPHTHFSHDSTL